MLKCSEAIKKCNSNSIVHRIIETINKVAKESETVKKKNSGKLFRLDKLRQH